MKAVFALCFVLVAASALEFQSVVNTANPFGAPVQMPTFGSILADAQKFTKAAGSAFSAHSVVMSTPKTLAVSAGCQTAVDALAAIFVSGDCQAVPSLGNAAEATDANVKTFCESACITNLKTKYAAIGTACTGADATVFSDTDLNMNMRKATDALETICTKEGDTYCWPKLVGLGSLESGPTVEKLDAVCTPCTRKLIVAAAAYGAQNAQAGAVLLDMLCMKRGEPAQYCMVVLQGMQAAMAAAQQTQDFSSMCHPCVAAIFAKIIEVSQFDGTEQSTVDAGKAFASIGGMLRAFCQKKNGELCINVIFRAMQTIQAGGDSCPDKATAATPCPGPCKDFAGMVKGQLGCCAGGLFTMLSQGDPTDTTKDFIEKSCGVVIGEPCSTAKVKAQFRITNLRFAYYLANKAAVEAKLKADLALFAGVSSSDIELIEVSEVADNAAPASVVRTLAVGAGINVRYDITPADEAQAAQITAQITSGAAVALPNTAGLPLDSREDATAAVGVDTTKSTAQTVGAAASLQASFAAVLLAAAVAVFAARQ